jgi:TonB family protein
VAASLRLQRTLVLALTVTPAGEPSSIAIVDPVGCGLDDQAARTVETWKFKPATLKGIPVPVRIDVEVSFNVQ